MRRWLIVVGVVALVLGSIYCGNEFLEVDDCLDHGGEWNYDLDVCDE